MIFGPLLRSICLGLNLPFALSFPSMVQTFYWCVKAAEHLGAVEEGDKKESRRSIEEVLADRPRSGAPPTFSAEQVCKIVAVACEDPEGSGRPVTHWSTPELADEVPKSIPSPSISRTKLGGAKSAATLDVSYHIRCERRP
jgi:hypothetical protein